MHLHKVVFKTSDSYYLNLENNLFSLFLGVTVGLPLVSLPQGVVGCCPLFDLPPWGWSTGFLAIPRTTGLKPMCLTKPAFFMYTSDCPELDTTPRETRQFSLSHMFQPERNFKRTSESTFFNMVAEEPAALQILEP